MKVLFKKNDNWYYYIKDDILTDGYIDVKVIGSILDLTNIKHLDDVKPLYHYIEDETSYRYPVYYEHNDKILTKRKYGSYGIVYTDTLTKDYTISNINLL